MTTLEQFSLQGRTALVTGASYGLGTRFAKVLAGAGANTVLAARSTDKLAAVAAEVERLGVKALPIGCDVTVPAQVAATVKQAWETFGRVDILVNNAGVVEAGVMPERITDERFAQTIATNVNGLFSFCREVGARQLKKREGSRPRRQSHRGLHHPERNGYDPTYLCPSSASHLVPPGISTVLASDPRPARREACADSGLPQIRPSPYPG